MTQILSSLSGLLAQGSWLALLVAFSAGVVTAFTPCSLSTVPLFLAYYGVGEKGYKPLVYVIAGNVLVSTTMGVIVASIGSMLRLTMYMGYVYIVMAVVLLAMALQMLGIFTFIKSTHLDGKVTKKGSVGAFVMGASGAIFSSPCSTPVMIVVLAVITVQGNLWLGALYLFLYALGHCIIYPISAFATNSLKTLRRSSRFKKFNRAITVLIATLLVVVAFYLLWIS